MRLKLDTNSCDLLSAFRAYNVRYLIIGGWAVSVHAQPRATQDRVEVPLETGTADFVSAEGLIAAKRASGREQDLADIRAIQRAQQQKPQ